MKKVPVVKFETHCLPLIEEVRAKNKPLLIKKKGKPVAKVVPLKGELKKTRASLRGTIIKETDIVSPVW